MGAAVPMAMTQRLDPLIARLSAGYRLVSDKGLLVLEAACADELAEAAVALTLEGFGECITYSRKVFLPLTELCRDVCHYCTFAKAPRRLKRAYMSPEEVLAV